MSDRREGDKVKAGGQPMLGELRADLAVEQARTAQLRRELHRTELLAADALEKLEQTAGHTGELKASVKQFEADHESLRQRVEALEAVRDELNHCNAKLTNDTDSLKAGLSNASQRLDQTAGHTIELEAKVRQFEADHQSLRKALDATRAELHDHTAKLTNDAESLKAGLSNVSQAIKQPAPTPSILGAINLQSLLPQWMRWRDRAPHTEKIVPLEIQRQAILRSEMFDQDWYRRKYPDIASAGLSPLDHFLKFGWREGRDPAPGFSTKFYIETNSDVRSSGVNPLYHYLIVGRFQGRPPSEDARYVESIDQVGVVAPEFDDEFYRMRSKLPLPRERAIEHYLRKGWRDGLDPHPQFSTRYYLTANADVWRAGINPYVHYLLTGRREGRLPRIFPKLTVEFLDQWRTMAREFDVAYYRSKYPDVVEKRFEPILHYLLEGWRLGYDPHPQFSTSHYLDSNSDVRNAGVNPYVHFLTEGRREGRFARQADSWAPRTAVKNAVAAEFDRSFYLTQNPDVAASGFDPLDHYLDYGWKEGRDPRPGFSTQFYLEANTDVAAAGVNPFYHYVVSGKSEGREADHPGGWRALALARLRPLEKQIEEAARTAPECGETLNGETLKRQLLRNPLKNVFLTFSHDEYTTSVGGIQLCLTLEDKLARERGAIHINLRPALPVAALSRDKTGMDNKLVVTCDGKRLGAISAGDLQQTLTELRGEIKRCALAIHSLLGHAPETIAQVHAVLEPRHSYLWLHDFFTVCPSYTLLRNGITFCHAPRHDSSACTLCAFGEERMDHLRRMRQLFDTVPLELVAPSAFAAEYWRSKSDLPAAKIHVQPHCWLESRGGAPPAVSAAGAVRVAFVGHPSPHKGWAAFLKLLAEFDGDSRYEFHHLGAGSQCDRRTTFTHVSVLKDGPSATIDALVTKDIDIVVLWSIWPETFSFVAHEAICADAFLVTCEDSGNIARIVRDRDGLVLRDEAALIEAFRSGSVEEIVLAKRARPKSLCSPVFSTMTFGLLEWAPK